MSTAPSPPAEEDTPAPTGPPPPAPTPAGPTKEEAVDGDHVTLVWHPLLGGRRHRVQVASDPDFEDVLFETTIGSENAVRVRWPELPETGSRFWRVQCFRHGVWGPYSAPSAFRFTGEPGEEIPEADPSAPATSPPAPSKKDKTDQTDTDVPHLVGVTSKRQATITVLVLLVCVALLVELALLAPVGSLITPEEAGGAEGSGSSAPPAFEATPDRLAEMVGTASAVEAGGQAFATYCASCHGQQGGGGVGPNLTDKYWIHGGTNMDIYQVLVEGVSNKGMPSWQGTLSEREMAQVVAFVRSLEGTEPAGAKAPEGDPVAASE